ncbi:unnamed protein product [Phaedon cochleariae]|uniref:Uncharacterized protein n=1 Tax=Phaedon cochleariae TaxID=80249 RepID=A0A9P0DP85_PHACE|nr:unnamed protein product [Phaedon cochleariae]
MIVVSMQFLTISSSGQEVRFRVKGAIFIITVISQLSFSCIPVSLLQDESEESNNAIYECQWEENTEDFKKKMNLIMMRSQSRISVTAGGLFEMDRMAYLNVCRSTWSIYTLLNTLQP